MYRNGPVSAASVKARGRTIVRSVTAAVGAGGVAVAGVIALVLPGGGHSRGRCRLHVHPALAGRVAPAPCGPVQHAQCSQPSQLDRL